MKKRITLVSLILITLLVLALPASMVAAAPETAAPVLIAAPAPALDLAEEGTMLFSVAENTGIPVIAQEVELQLLAAGLILITIVASVATLRRKIIMSIGHRIADTFSPGTGGPFKFPLAGG